jgi:putative hydrolase of the HAD superfamily
MISDEDGDANMIKAILFDLDETLILDEPVTMEALEAAASYAAARAPVDPARLAEAARRAGRRLWQEGPYASYCDRIGHSFAEGWWARYDRGDHPAIAGLREWAPFYRLQTWREALAEQGVADDGLAAELANRFFTARRKYPRYPEVEGLLATLRRKYLLGIVTNGVPDLQREKIEGCGLAHLFHAGVVSGEIDCGKPDPGIFHHICGELGVEPGECVMVGDNPDRDVAGAIAAGMKSVWVDRGYRPRSERYRADLACADLSAMLPWLADM